MIDRALLRFSALSISKAISQFAAAFLGLPAGSTELLQTSLCVSVYVLYEFGFRTECVLRDFPLSSDSELGAGMVSVTLFSLSSESELSENGELFC